MSHKRRRRRRKNPAGFPLWMWAVGAGAAYWWYKKRPAAVAPTVQPGQPPPGAPPPPPEPTVEQDMLRAKAAMLEGMGYICHQPR